MTGNVGSVFDSVERDGYCIVMQFGVHYDGKYRRCGSIGRRALFLLAKSHDMISTDELATNADPSCDGVSIYAALSKTKMGLKITGIPWPIVNIPGEGYKWVGPDAASRKIAGWFGSAAHRARVERSSSRQMEQI
jgi:hypothetical protein